MLDMVYITNYSWDIGLVNTTKTAKEGGFTTVHNNIAEIRKRRGYSQIEFAEMVGITNWWLNHIESTKHKPSLTLSIKIADKLDVTLNDIFLE